MEEEVDELGDLKVIDCDRWLTSRGIDDSSRSFYAWLR